MIGCAPAQNRSCGLPTSQPRNLHGSFEVTVTGRWQKPTVAVASVSQAHATSVGSTADLRFATPAPSTVVLWHTPRLDDAWDPPPRRGSPPSTYFVFAWGNTRKACIMQRTRPLPTRYPFCLPIRAVFSSAGRCSVHSRRVQTYRHFKFPLNRGAKKSASSGSIYNDRIPGSQPCPAESRDDSPSNHEPTQLLGFINGNVVTKPARH